MRTTHSKRLQHALRRFVRETGSNQRARTQRDLLDAAKASNVLFMEAMKPPFYPLFRRRGTPRKRPDWRHRIRTRRQFLGRRTSRHPSFSLEHYGGALLGIGIYEAFLATYFLGAAINVTEQSAKSGRPA